MSKTIIVSNRLPLSLNINQNEVEATPSVGGLATGLKSVHAEGNGIWIGWSGLTVEETNPSLAPKVEKALHNQKCRSVSLSEKEVDGFYYGFSNRTLWPLFHYFTEYSEFNNEDWETYKRVNQKFADLVIENIEDEDRVWVHDYQLLLVPQMIKEKKPNVKIGFFLHIPFPSYEVFRTLPWREEILQGMMGSDLIGFHTYDYERHFLSSVQRLLICDLDFNNILYDTRNVKVDSFPMGIDFTKFHNAAIEHSKSKTKSEVQESIDKHKLIKGDTQFILSIDRLDYTKGIAQRILAFEHFLEKFPEYLGKVRLVMLAVPSRSNVPQYQDLKNEIDQLVGRVNGKFSEVNWTPIWYFYRSMPFENLIDLYCSCKIALLTPVRDGMNLVAKEYIASRVDNTGVLILSEMAGAAKELNEALIINPNNLDQIADAIKTALEMPEKDQIKGNIIMKDRVQRYNVERWANEFLVSLEDVLSVKPETAAMPVKGNVEESIVNEFRNAESRLLFLDYDGTLAAFKNRPEDAYPTKELYEILDQLQANPKNNLVLITGRDRETFDGWFGSKPYTLITEHGLWQKNGVGSEWIQLEQVNNRWFSVIFPILERFTDRTPGSQIEIKNYSIAWHYRRVDPVLGEARANELKNTIQPLIGNHSLEIMEGDKVMEVKVSGVNKGKAATKFLANIEPDYIISMGDDWTDEFMFQDLPDTSTTIKVGNKKTVARFRINNTKSVYELLRKFI
ncbi:bifunctional alpha,alpha-trehalose-phosphate synthase (UDP-forming)/trehalose-phosphatase [uncultured Arcticibacterium sp.]|uniref:bifunctional alpha,alpha-trehalose-phosphate synthase (UDP-forming)/trehalose-phosphatase n=1 Tax=uncultured Arcticibacterium sp. TaxID=2173042 RepID=UPI0030FB19C3